MTSTQAFARSEDLIKNIDKVPYIPQHSGEIWEIAYFREQGFSREGIHTLYRNFTEMLKDDLFSSPDKIINQERLFKELVEYSLGGQYERV